MLRITTPHWNVIDANQALLRMFRVSTLDEVKETNLHDDPSGTKTIGHTVVGKGYVEDS